MIECSHHINTNPTGPDLPMVLGGGSGACLSAQAPQELSEFGHLVSDV